MSTMDIFAQKMLAFKTMKDGFIKKKFLFDYITGLILIVI